MTFYYISYDDEDVDFVNKVLLPNLESSGINGWVDEKQALHDPNMSNGVNSAINRSYGVVVIVSKASMESENVKYEWGYAHYIKKPIIPIMIEAPEVIGANGRLKIVFDVHEKLARETWYNFSDKSHLEWDTLKHALVSIASTKQTPLTTLNMPALEI